MNDNSDEYVVLCKLGKGKFCSEDLIKLEISIFKCTNIALWKPAVKKTENSFRIGILALFRTKFSVGSPLL